MRKGLLIAGIVLALAAVGSVAIWAYHGEPQFCSVCHIMKPYLASWNEPGTLANAHAKAEVECLDCHEQAAGQQVESLVKFVRGDYKVPLEQRKFTKEWCFRCHGSYEDLIEQTKYYTLNGKRVNPHAYRVDPKAPGPDIYKTDPKAPDPHGTEDGELECYSCHQMHGGSASSVESCYSCHHDAIFTTGCVLGNCHSD